MKKLLVLPLVLLLAGCDAELRPIAIKSAVVTHNSGVTASPDRTELSPAQLEQLSGWFAAHKDGWQFKLSDTPAGTVLLLKDKDGRTTTVNLVGNTLWVGNRCKVLTNEELKAIETILDARNRLPTFGR